MQKYIDSVVIYTGTALLPLSGAVVTIVNTNGIGPNTMYSDNGITVIASTLTDSVGNLSFYAANGTYTVTVTAGTTVVSRQIQLEDTSTLDATLAMMQAVPQVNAAADGDLRVISTDLSKYREGTSSRLSGDIYTLLGANANAQAMWYRSHGFPISATGMFGASEETQACTLEVYYEGGQIRYYNYAGATVGIVVTPANFTLVYIFDLNNGNFSGPSLQNFRLTLTTATAVTSADVVGGTSVFCTPYSGNRIALWDSTLGVVINYSSAEFSLALAGLTSGLPYDVFCYQNAGVPTLEFLAWASTSARTTGLSFQNGLLCKTGAPTRRYLGSFLTTGVTTTEDSQANRYLFNYYNRTRRSMRRVEATASWAYTIATWRQANGAVANQLNFFVGVVEDSIEATITATVSSNTAGTAVDSGIALNSITVPSRYLTSTAPVAAYNVSMAPADSYVPVLGKNYVAWLERSAAVGVTTWLGAGLNCGLAGKVMA